MWWICSNIKRHSLVNPNWLQLAIREPCCLRCWSMRYLWMDETVWNWPSLNARGTEVSICPIRCSKCTQSDLTWWICYNFLCKVFQIVEKLPADAVPMSGWPGLAADTSHTPSLWPVNSPSSWQLNVGVLKLDTILLVCTFSLCLALTFCVLCVTVKNKATHYFIYCFVFWSKRIQLHFCFDFAWTSKSTLSTVGFSLIQDSLSNFSLSISIFSCTVILID